MKITLLLMGKTDEQYIRKGMADYEKRLKHYIPLSVEEIPALKQVKNFSEDQLKQKEGQMILTRIQPTDHLSLLDEKGKRINSVEFAGHLNGLFSRSIRRLVFATGGAYGFSQEVYQRANDQISLSAMTFSHQLVRLVFLEQLYRAFTILRNEPYHHL